jgi:exodeoxyribonuclease VII small subunit
MTNKDMTNKDMTNNAPGITSLSFEKALAELEMIVKKLEQGNVDLDESILIYERGEALKKHCEKLLTLAEKRIEKIVPGPDGQAVSTVSLDGEEA